MSNYSRPQYGSADSVDTDNLSEPEMQSSKCRLQRRHLVTILAFFGFANIYAMRANLSVAIVLMTSDTIITVDGQQQVRKAEFDNWDSVTQGIILGAFFYGYILTQILGGCLAHRCGGKYVYLTSVFGTAVFTLLSPPLAQMGKIPFMGARFVEGLFEGVSYPAMHTILANWAPAMEKTRMSAVAYAGSYFGTVIAMPVSAVLGYRFGWSTIFYFFGVTALLWCYFWVKMFYELPENDPNISTEELTLLKRETKQATNSAVPWKQILSSKAVWAIITAHFCQNWGFYTMLTSLPRILENIFDYDHEKAGFLSALPYLIMGFVLLVAGVFADFLRERYMWSTIKARKVFCSLGLLGEAVFLLLATTNLWGWLVLVLLMTSIGLGGLPWSAFSVNSIDIAPQYAGHLMGISNTLATLPGMFSTLFVGAVVRNQLSSEWHVVFFYTSGIYAFGSLVFWIWAKGEMQTWASCQAVLPEIMD